jgi:transposase
VEITESALAGFFGAMLPHLDERQRRLMVGSAAVMLGHGGRTKVAKLSGVSRPTVSKGADEIEAGAEVTDRLRSVGAGAKPAVETQPGLLEALDALVDPETRGSPMSLLRWTSKSTYELARELVAQGYQVSAELVRRLLHQMGYSLQAPAKEKEGTTHPDRNAQFEYLNSLTARRVEAGEPVISVDTKKKELVGDFHNGGREWQPKGEPERVRVHDFIDRDLGRAIPYGIYDIGNDEGWVSVGNTADTAEFAVNSIRTWWNQMGRERFPDATRLLITADAGGSNGYRIRAWKHRLAALATDTGLEITVCHYPPGTSKWNKIEHRMFSFITMNWRGRPLTSLRTIVELIAATTTQTGLTIRADHDPTEYLKGVKISDAELAAVPLTRHDWHGDWNYTINPTLETTN